MSNDSKRRLVAILFADVEGYTTMMESEEPRALTVLERFQTVIAEQVTQHHGELVKSYGDGSLVIFDSSIDALNAAAAMQKAFRESPKVPMRIGIHLGEVIKERGDYFGNGINIASRIESMSVAGGVLFSKYVAKRIRNQPEYDMRSLGTFDFKNVEEPLEVFALANEGFPVPKRNDLKGKVNQTKPISRKWIIALFAVGFLSMVSFYINWQIGAKEFAPTEKSIAVLPFRDLSPKGDQEYFSDGVAEEILNALSKLEELKVAGRISSFSFKDQPNVPLQEIGEKLNVSTVLTGGVRKNENQIRVTADLVNVADGFQIWSESYNMELKDIFDIQETIAQSIVNKFQLGQQDEASNLFAERQTDNLEAYEQYLRGVFYFNKNLDGMEEAAKAFEKAVELDPNYTEAYVGLGEAYFHLGFYGIWPRAEAFEKLDEASQKAIALDPDHPGCHALLGFYYFFNDWNWQSALNTFEKSTNSKQVWASYELYQLLMDPSPKNQENLILERQRMVKNDPLSVRALLELNRAYLWARQYDKVIQNTQKIFELDPNQRSAMRHISEAYMFSGQPEKAMPYTERMINLYNYSYFDYILNLVLLGRKEEAMGLYEERKKDLNPFVKATCSIALGELDSAFVHLDQGIEEKHPYLIFYKVGPHIDPIRSDPRYAEFEKKMNFPQPLKD